MNLHEHHDDLVRHHDDPDGLDAALANAIERGRRYRHRRRRAIQSTVAAIVLLAGLGVSMAFAARTEDRTRVTTGAGRLEPTGHSTTTLLTPTANLGPSGRLRLLAPDWKTTTRENTTSAAAGAAYTVTSTDGEVLEKGNVGTHGELITNQPPGTVVVAISRCDFSQPFEVVRGKTTTAEFTCTAKTLPSQSIPKTGRNPTDDEIRSAHRESIECMEAAGLTVKDEHLEITPGGQVGERRVQFSIAGSGMDFDQADAVQARCEKRYLALAFARSDYLDAHGN